MIEFFVRSRASLFQFLAIELFSMKIEIFPQVFAFFLKKINIPFSPSFFYLDPSSGHLCTLLSLATSAICAPSFSDKDGDDEQKSDGQV